MRLRTKRLYLRPLRAEDAAIVFAIMSDAAAMRFWDWPAIRDFETAAEIVAAQIADMEAGRACYWAMALDPAGPAFGCCDLSEHDHRHKRAELGFFVDRAQWGHGYAREAVTAAISHAWNELRLERLWARCHAGNDRSRKLLEALGFAYEGLLRGHVSREGERRDCVVYGRLRG